MAAAAGEPPPCLRMRSVNGESRAAPMGQEAPPCNACRRESCRSWAARFAPWPVLALCAAGLLAHWRPVAASPALVAAGPGCRRAAAAALVASTARPGCRWPCCRSWAARCRSGPFLDDCRRAGPAAGGLLPLAPALVAAGPAAGAGRPAADPADPARAGWPCIVHTTPPAAHHAAASSRRRGARPRMQHLRCCSYRDATRHHATRAPPGSNTYGVALIATGVMCTRIP